MATVNHAPTAETATDMRDRDNDFTWQVESQIKFFLSAAELVSPSRVYRLCKRSLDVVVTVLGLLLLFPVFVLIAIAIRLDSTGPVLFVQQRVGRYGRLFNLVKFRSMVISDDDPSHFEVLKAEGDPRVTRVGRILRKTSLDELPQLINVLCGDMSLVGPRPEIVQIVATCYEPWQFRRFCVPQGMTGWWQITGRSEKPMLEHTADDLFYIDHASFRFDLYILFKTLWVVLSCRGAF